MAYTQENPYDSPQLPDTSEPGGTDESVTLSKAVLFVLATPRAGHLSAWD